MSRLSRKDGGVMRRIDLGSQGLRVPAIGLGCMGMSEFYGSSSEAQNLRVLDRAAELGCTFWNTSDMYGPFKNEILLSKALAGRRDRITLTTKFGISRGEDGSWRGVRSNAGYVKACCDASACGARTPMSTIPSEIARPTSSRASPMNAWISTSNAFSASYSTLRAICAIAVQASGSGSQGLSTRESRSLGMVIVPPRGTA
jgi:hypothetical protein